MPLFNSKKVQEDHRTDFFIGNVLCVYVREANGDEELKKIHPRPVEGCSVQSEPIEQESL